MIVDGVCNVSRTEFVQVDLVITLSLRRVLSGIEYLGAPKLLQLNEAFDVLMR